MSEKMNFTRSSGNVFRDAGYSEEKAKNLQFRSYLMIALKKYITDNNWSLKEAAQKLDVPKQHISNLIHGKIDLFNTDTLIEMLEKTGLKIYEKYEKIDQDLDKKFKPYHFVHPRIFCKASKHMSYQNTTI